MAYATGTTHYNLPQTVGTDVRDWSDTNQAFEDVDTALYGAVQDVATVGSNVTTLDNQINTPSTGLAAQLGTAQTDIIALDGRLQTVEGTVASHTTQIGDVRSDAEDMICAYNEPSSTSTHAYAIGDYFIYNDVLYKATAVINIGDTITPDTNCSTTNVTTELDSIAAATAGAVGDLTSLTTTDKSSAVAAINEVNSDLTNVEIYKVGSNQSLEIRRISLTTSSTAGTGSSLSLPNGWSWNDTDILSADMYNEGNTSYTTFPRDTNNIIQIANDNTITVSSEYTSRFVTIVLLHLKTS